ncbi:MAG: hypothetical protein WCH61_01590 [bacterium]
MHRSCFFELDWPSKRFDQPSCRKNYLHPALAAGWLEMSNPASPRSPVQRYRRANRHACGITAGGNEG